nr:DUF1887 family CARF protein [uncultured Cellulosilyticum sp.]
MTKWHILIHFIENFNDEMALLTKILAPKQVVLVSSEKLTPQSKLQQVLNYMKSERIQVETQVVFYEQEEPLELTEQLLPYLKEEAAVNLAGTSPLEALLMTNLKNKYKVTMLYPDIRQNRLYVFRQDQLEVQILSKVIGSLEVKDYLALGGGLVLQDEKSKYETPLYEAMLHFLLEHYEDIFSKIKHLFKPTTLHFSAPYEKEFYFEIGRLDLEREHQIALRHYLEYLKEIKWIRRFEEYKVSTRVYAQNKEIEHYLSSGAWLEHVTYYYMKSIPGIRDVHTGFKFAWHTTEKHVHNELDVVATLNNHLICISCKDTDKYDYQTLNELEVYATRLGGPESIKILVTTMPPIKSSTLDRAKGMGIHIIQIEDSLKTLSDKLNTLV